jgi:predicted dehydrogenase
MDDTDYHNPENARLKPETGGGALLDVGCYGISTARWLLDTEPQEVQAQAVYHSSGVDVHLAGILRFPNDALASLEASFISALQQTFTVIGDRGAVDLPHNAYIPWERDAMFTFRQYDEETGEENKVKGADEYQLMVEHFADAVLGKTTLRFSLNDSISNMKVIDAMAMAARTGETVSVKK